MRTNHTVTANFSGGVYPVQFAAPAVSTTNIQFSLVGAPQQAYDVDVSTNLTDWMLFKTVTNTNGAIPLKDSTTTSAAKYYRATAH